MHSGLSYPEVAAPLVEDAGCGVVVDLKGLTLTCIAVCPCTAHREQRSSQDLLLQAAAGAWADRLSTGDDRQRVENIFVH